MSAIPFDIDGRHAAWAGMLGKAPVHDDVAPGSFDIAGQETAWAGAMSNISGAPRREQASRVHGCETCDESVPCSGCSGDSQVAVSHPIQASEAPLVMGADHPAVQALRWAESQIPADIDPFWRAACLADSVRTAPSHTMDAAWKGLDAFLAVSPLNTPAKGPPRGEPIGGHCIPLPGGGTGYVPPGGTSSPGPTCCCPLSLKIVPHATPDGRRSFALNERASRPGHDKCIGVSFDVDFKFKWIVGLPGLCTINWWERSNLGNSPGTWMPFGGSHGRSSPTFDNWRRQMNPGLGDPMPGTTFSTESARIAAEAASSAGTEQTIPMFDAPCLDPELGMVLNIQGHIEIEPGCPECQTLTADWFLHVKMGPGGLVAETVYFVQSTSDAGSWTSPDTHQLHQDIEAKRAEFREGVVVPR